MQGDFEQIRAHEAPPMREWAQMPSSDANHDDMHAPLPPLPPMPPLMMEEHEEGHHDEQLLLPAPAGDEEVVFDRTVQARTRDSFAPAPVREPLVKTRDMPKKTFVSVNDYKTILTETNMVRQRLMTADNFVKKLTDLKQEEERSLERWRSQLEDVEKKLAYVDQLIEKAQR